MINYTIRRPGPANSRLWEWKTHMPIENHTLVEVQKFGTRAEAEAAAAAWDSTAQIVEITVPDV
jgi:hypothetical protein